MQFALAIAIAVAPVLLALVAFGLLMVISGHDALIVAAVVVGAAVAAAIAAWFVTSALLRDVRAIRDGLIAFGKGEREVPIETQVHDEFADLAAAANTMMDRIVEDRAARERSESARKELVAAVSHDLRTPITSLRLIAQAVGDEVIDEAVRRGYLETMSTHIDALTALIDDLFELSRLEAGNVCWPLQRVPLHELVAETIDAMRVQAEASRVTVAAELPAALVPARANPEKLQRVLFNLIQNSLRHTPADGSVVVRAEQVDGGIELEVADTGQGIGLDDRQHIFAAFYRGRADASRTSAGAGLGLAVSRAIVEAHGGRIWLADAELGTRVRFSLPVAA